jgi:hypothetical protein
MLPPSSGFLKMDMACYPPPRIYGVTTHTTYAELKLLLGPGGGGKREREREKKKKKKPVRKA